MSTDDFLKELRRDMGSELAPVYHALWHEVVWLHVKWKRYCQLYAPSSEHIPLLKRVASEFFGVLGFALWEDVVLHAARLTDPPETGKGKRAYPNLTLQRLPTLVDHAVRDELQELVVTAVEACKTLKARRDKWIAHRDLNLHLMLLLVSFLVLTLVR